MGRRVGGALAFDATGTSSQGRERAGGEGQGSLITCDNTGWCASRIAGPCPPPLALTRPFPDNAPLFPDRAVHTQWQPAGRQTRVGADHQPNLCTPPALSVRLDY